MRSGVDCIITRTSSCGEVDVILKGRNGVRYRYFLDAGFIPKVEKMMKHASGKGLNFLKQVAYKYERIGE